MRTQDQIDKIKQHIQDPYTVEEFLSTEDVAYLIELFENNKDNVNAPAVYKNTGPVTLDLKLFLDDIVINNIVTRLEQHIGPFEITAAFFFFTDYPHIIHNDDTFELPNDVYKGITIPLRIDGPGTTSLCFFDQFYFHGPAKFFNGSKDIPTYYNQQLYNYKDVDGLVSGLAIHESFVVSHLTHLKPSWLEGLTIHSAIEWKPTSAIIFDSTRLHCASDFRRQDIKSKLGISIFTKKL